MLKNLSDWIDTHVIVPTRKLPSIDVFRACLLGVYGGLFPVPGVTTAIVTLLIFICRFFKIFLSGPLVGFALTINFILTPINLLCIPIFSNYGISILSPQAHCPWTEILEISWSQMFRDFSFCFGSAIFFWLCFSPIFTILIIYINDHHFGKTLKVKGVEMHDPMEVESLIGNRAKSKGMSSDISPTQFPPTRHDTGDLEEMIDGNASCNSARGRPI